MAETSLREYCGLIEDLIEQGRYAEAVTRGKQVLAQYPKYMHAYRLLGQAMLEARQNEHAVDMFRRVLSADPEDMFSWVALSEVYSQNDELGAALWHLERAFELAVDNKIVEDELRQLYARRDGVEPRRVELTRGALARLYLKGDLLSRAVSELRALLAESPDRVDLEVALAEALWRNEQRLEASEVCQRILDRLPYCLRANLILGEIWMSSGREEGQVYLRRAEALDPENRVAQELLGDRSPLSAQEVQISVEDYRPPVEEERPAWMSEVEVVSTGGGPPLTEREATLVDIAAALEAQIEIPAWLEEIDIGEAGEEPEPFALAESLEESPLEEAAAPMEGAPEWLLGMGVETPLEGAPSALGESEVPEWLAGVGMGAIAEEEAPAAGAGEVPEWLTEAGLETAVEGAVPAAQVEEGVPEWLTGGEAEPAGEEVVPSVVPAEGAPEWLTDLRGQFIEEVAAPVEAAPPIEEVAPVAEEGFGWTAFGEPEAPPPEVIPSVEAPVAVEEEAGVPSWLEGGEMPSGEEALAWLEQLAAGKEEELLAQAEAESEVRMAAIMGRQRPEPPAEEVTVVEEAVPTEAPAPAEVPAWIQELAPPEVAAPPEAAAPEVALPVEEAAPVAEEGFGWTAFGEAEALTEEIVEEEILEEVVAPVAEEPFGWTPFGEPEAAAPAVAQAAEPAAVEEVEAPPTVEMPVLEEVAATPMVEEAPPVMVGPPLALPAERAAAPFAAERAYLKEHPRDFDARLALARALWQADEREEALESYMRLIRAGKQLDVITPELEGYLEQWPDVATQRVLGDAYMKDGRLEEALDLYRRALETL